MRISGGALRGQRIATPRGDATRPTSERVREALFSILGPPVADLAVLDLFCGAGTLSIEALSRGAGSAVLVDSGRAAHKIVRENLARLKLGDRAELLPIPVAAALKALGKRRPQPGFGWVFIDPPYASDLAERALEALAASELLAVDTVVIAEHDRRRAPAGEVGCLVRTDRRRYGDTELSIYRRSHEEAE